MNYMSAIYAGTFDPFTIGHQAVMQKAIKIFEKVTIVIALSPNKDPIFSVKDRSRMLREIFKKESKVEVVHWKGLLVDFAKKNKIGTIIRGLRPTGDFESEYQMAVMNSKLLPTLQTVFFVTEPNLNYISSSLVREIFNHGGDVSEFIPDEIKKYFRKVKGSK